MTLVTVPGGYRISIASKLAACRCGSNGSPIGSKRLRPCLAKASRRVRRVASTPARSPVTEGSARWSAGTQSRARSRLSTDDSKSPAKSAAAYRTASSRWRLLLSANVFLLGKRSQQAILRRRQLGGEILDGWLPCRERRRLGIFLGHGSSSRSAFKASYPRERFCSSTSSNWASTTLSSPAVPFDVAVCSPAPPAGACVAL